MSNTVFPTAQGPPRQDAGPAAESDATLVLAVDTATGARGVALSRGTRLIARRIEPLREAQSLGLLSDIDGLLRGAGVSLRDLGLMAAAVGPGSFTGLRSGLATVKAFSAIHGTPVAAVPTLHAVGACAGPSTRTVAAIPAGRGEVFAQLLAVGDDLRVRELSEPLHVRPGELFARALKWGGQIAWVGEGARAHAEAIVEASLTATHSAAEQRSIVGGAGGGGRRDWVVAEPVMSYTEAITRLGLISKADGRTVAADGLRALYVRPSDAELNEQG